MTEPEYIAYFENLASQHVAIRHSENRQAFYVVHDDNMTELENAIRNDLKLPALLLDQYYDDLTTDSDNNRLTVLGGISVICQVEMANTASVRAARDQARKLARSILNRLRKDCRFGGVLVNQKILVRPDTHGEPTGVIGGGTATGWGYSFSLLMPTQVAVDPDEWLDS